MARGQTSCWSLEPHLFMTSDIVICLFLDLHSPRDRGSSSIFWVLWKRKEFLHLHPTANWKARYSFNFLFHPWERSPLPSPILCTLVEEQCWQSSFYPLQCSQTHILLLLFNRVLEALLRKPGLLQILFYLWAFVQSQRPPGDSKPQ